MLVYRGVEHEYLKFVFCRFISLLRLYLFTFFFRSIQLGLQQKKGSSKTGMISEGFVESTYVFKYFSFSLGRKFGQFST